MKTLQVCVIGTKKSGKSTVVANLQQKNELSTEEFQIFSFKQGNSLVYLGDAPYQPENIKPTLALMEESDACILCISALEGITPQLGEIILMMSAKNITKGIIAITKTDSAPENIDKISAQIKAILVDSSLKDYEIIGTSSITNEGFVEIRESLVTIEPASKDASAPFKMEIEASKEVKSGITGIVGLINSGSLKKYDKTYMMPWGKEFIVQEIYIENQLVDSAKAGDRVEIVYKGLNKWDVQTGDVASAEILQKSNKIKIEFTVNKFFKDDLKTEGEVMLNIGMQTFPANIISISKDNSSANQLSPGETGLITLQSKLQFAFVKDQSCIIYHPNAHWKSIKMPGKGKVLSGE